MLSLHSTLEVQCNIFIQKKCKLKAIKGSIQEKNARQQQRKVTWALAESLNTLRTPWLGAYTLCTSLSRSEWSPKEIGPPDQFLRSTWSPQDQSLLKEGIPP